MDLHSVIPHRHEHSGIKNHTRGRRRPSTARPGASPSSRPRRPAASSARTGCSFRTAITTLTRVTARSGSRAVRTAPKTSSAMSTSTTLYDQNGGSVKTWSAHQRTYNAGDPTWMNSKGSEIIGAINYLAEQGVNSQYMMLMTYNGDGKDVWPWIDPRSAQSLTCRSSRNGRSCSSTWTTWALPNISSYRRQRTISCSAA